MIAIFTKELRENLKWALLIAGALGVLVYFQVREQDPLMMFELAAQRTAFFAPLAGLLMGVVQTLFETRPDNWAFVVHRPLPRLGIFVAKCGAGILLLYGSMAVPCLLAAMWAATPGNLPMPFQAREILPVVTDILTAGCYYFAGMILTLRDVRWHGSRLLPLGLALVCSGAVVRLVPEFWQALLVIVVVQILAALAAWGAFAMGGSDDLSQAGNFGLAAMIYAGALCVALFLALVSNISLPSAAWEEYKMDREGNLLKITWAKQEGHYRTAVVTDAAGSPLTQYEGIDMDDPANADRFLRFQSVLNDERYTPWPVSILTYGYRNPTAGIIRLRAVAPPDVRLPYICLFDMQQRIIDLYDSVTHELKGTVGPEGFAPGHARPNASFPGAPLNLRHQAGMHTLAFSSTVYWMELDQRRVRPVFTASENDPVVSAVELPSRTDPKIVIATRNHLYLLNASSQVIFSTALNADWSRNFYMPAILPSHRHLVVFVSTGPGDERPYREYLEFGNDGGIVRRTDVPKAPDHEDLGKMIRTAVFGCLYPAAALPLLPGWIRDGSFGVASQQYVFVFRAFIIGSSVLCAVITIFLGKRYGFGIGKIIAWSATNPLLGPASVAVMLSLNEWPVREVCPACNSWKLAGQRNCLICGAEPSAVELDGREIFEAAERSQLADWSHLITPIQTDHPQ